MKILFVHQNFPGQFKHLAPVLAAAGHDVRAVAINHHPTPGVTIRLYKPEPPKGYRPFGLAAEFDAKVIRGEAAAAAMGQLRDGGYEPELVIANPGWGEALFVKDVWPRAKLVCLLEFYYRAEGGDVGFDPEFPGRSGPATGMRLRVKNMALLEALNSMDLGVVPTAWQRSCLPAIFQPKLAEIFDGIDTDAVRPEPTARATLPDGTVLSAGDPVVTYVSRNIEPYRGAHVFMRSLPALLARCPQAQVLIVGADGVSYGAPAPAGRTWKEIFWNEVRARVDERRVHFVGHLPYAQYLRVLQVSAAHVYLTYPFVLSWSCLEAMSAGCHLVGSRTAPVQEFVTDGVNGTLVDFFDVDGLAAALARVLESRGGDSGLRAAARETAVRRCDLRRVALPRYRRVLGELMGAAV